MPLGPELLGLAETIDIDQQGRAMRIISRKGAPHLFETEHELSRIKVDEALRSFEATVDQKAGIINSIFDAEGVGPRMSAGELLFGSYTSNPVLRPDKIGYVVYETNDQGVTKARAVHAVPALREAQIDRLLGTTGTEVRELQLSFDMGKGGKLLTFPVDFGPKERGGKALEGLFSMVMEHVEQPTSPLVIVGDQESLAGNLELAGINEEWRPIRMSSGLREELNVQIRRSGQIFSASSMAEIPEAFESEEADVEALQAVSGEVLYQNGAFLTGVALDTVDGNRFAYLLNKQLSFPYQDHDGTEVEEVTEGAVFPVLTYDEKGNWYIATVLQRRIAGNTGKFEIPRGFPNKFWGELQEELGLGPNFVREFRLGSVKLAEDPLRANVQPDFNPIILPSDKRQVLKSEATRPASEIEVISPNWMRLQEFIEGAVDGELIWDAHSIAGLTLLLSMAGALTPTEVAEHQAVILEKFQDWRTGSYRLMIPRGDTKQMSTLDGELNPNSGISRIWNNIGVDEDPTVLGTGSYEIVPVEETLRMINKGDLDIVTMSALFKTYLQRGLAQINLQVLDSLR